MCTGDACRALRMGSGPIGWGKGVGGSGKGGNGHSNQQKPRHVQLYPTVQPVSNAFCVPPFMTSLIKWSVSLVAPS